jgi:hypothetical protein
MNRVFKPLQNSKILKSFLPMSNQTNKILDLRLVFLTLSIAIFGWNQTFAQDQQEKTKFKFAGSVALNQDFYSYNTNDTMYLAYRPMSMTRIMGSASLSYGKFSMPFSLSYTLQKSNVNYYSPISSKFRLRDFVQNYNQLSLSPTIGKFKAFLGTQVPQYSQLTSGELPVFGAGFEWKPKKFVLAAHYGVSQRAVDYDSLKGVPGAFKRISMGAKIGYGKEEFSHIYLVVLNHSENAGSASVMPNSGIRPQENVVASLCPKIVILKKFFIEGDLALSAYNGDVNDPVIKLDTFVEKVPTFLLNIVTTRYSSSLGAAAIGALGYNGDKWGIKAVVKGYSPGYLTLNYPFFQNDRLEGLMEMRMTLFKSKVNFNGSYGYRLDNIMGARNTTTNQTLGSANLSVQILPNWNVSSNFANFGVRNDFSNDTLRLQNINNSIGFSSNIFFTREKMVHSIIASYSNAAYNDYNIVSGHLADNTSRVMILTYSVTLTKLPLTFSAIGSSFRNQMWIGDLGVSMASLGVNYLFGKKKDLRTSLQTNYIHTTLPAYTADQSVNTTISANYTLKRKLRLGIITSINIFRHGSAKPGILNQENTVRLMAQYAF